MYLKNYFWRAIFLFGTADSSAGTLTALMQHDAKNTAATAACRFWCFNYAMLSLSLLYTYLNRLNVDSHF